jgi:hypothetical protein
VLEQERTPGGLRPGNDPSGRIGGHPHPPAFPGRNADSEASSVSVSPRPRKPTVCSTMTRRQARFLPNALPGILARRSRSSTSG